MAKATTQASKQPAANSRDQRLKMMPLMQNNIDAGAGAGEFPGVVVNVPAANILKKQNKRVLLCRLARARRPRRRMEEMHLMKRLRIMLCGTNSKTSTPMYMDEDGPEVAPYSFVASCHSALGTDDAVAAHPGAHGFSDCICHQSVPLRCIHFAKCGGGTGGQAHGAGWRGMYTFWIGASRTSSLIL